MSVNENEVIYGFVDENNVLIEFAIINKDDDETLQRIKNEYNAFAAYPMDFTKELATLNYVYWNGSRFVWPSPHPDWTWNEELNDWQPPVVDE